jgi:hypothetical protein
VQGAADTWWLGPQQAIAIYRGEATLFADPSRQVATVYSGTTPLHLG